MYSDLFVHRVTGMLKATGLRMPGRVVGGGIFLEYDDRLVADVASIIADFHEGVQGVVSSTMVVSEEQKLEHLIRGHYGLLLFEKSCYVNGPHARLE